MRAAALLWPRHPLGGTSILRNAVPQFGKPRGARVGTVAVVGGTGRYAGATGTMGGHHLPSGVTEDVARVHVP